MSKSSEGGSHWYKTDGTPCHTIDGRQTTLADARRLNLLPSVTGILSVITAPQLEQWKQDQCSLAAVTTPRFDLEKEYLWCGRVRDAAFQQVDDAAELGSRVHKAIEQGLTGNPYDPEMAVYAQPIIDWANKTSIEVVSQEIVAVNLEHGFAGTCDCKFTFGKRGKGILDFKSKKTKPGKPVVAYDTQGMQLAASSVTLWGEEVTQAILANVYFSTTEIGRFDVVRHSDLLALWEAFKHAAGLWRFINKYDPRVTVTETIP